jgi:hypothetical protein
MSWCRLLFRAYDYCSIALYLFLWRLPSDLGCSFRSCSIHIIRSNTLRYLMKSDITVIIICLCESFYLSKALRETINLAIVDMIVVGCLKTSNAMEIFLNSPEIRNTSEHVLILASQTGPCDFLDMYNSILQVQVYDPFFDFFSCSMICLLQLPRVSLMP